MVLVDLETKYWIRWTTILIHYSYSYGLNSGHPICKLGLQFLLYNLNNSDFLDTYADALIHNLVVISLLMQYCMG